MVLTFSWVIGVMVCHGLLFFIQNYRKESIDAKALASTVSVEISINIFANNLPFSQ